MANAPEEDSKKSLLGNALGPAARDFGTTVQPLGHETGEVVVRAVRVGLKSVSGLVFEKIAAYLESSLARRLKDVPTERIGEANARIAVPAIEAMRYSSDEHEIREMFTNLIAADLDTLTKPSAHPSFVEIVKQMSVIDARVLKEISNDSSKGTIFSVRVYEQSDKPNQYQRVDLHTPLGDNASFDDVMIAVSSLARLGLIRTSDTGYPSNAIETHNAYKAGEHYKEALTQFEKIANRVEENHTGIWLTALGRAFVKVCF